MKVTTLVENTAISPEYKSQHGLCFYIETLKHKILFDLGPNKLFLENAKLLGVDIGEIDIVIISHGHGDHGGALKQFIANNSKARIYIRETAFKKYYTKVFGIPVFVGLDSSVKSNERVILTGERLTIDEELELFSGVTERECYSSSNNALFVKDERGFVNDTFGHEQNLIIKEKDKSVLFAGCAHNGIVNIQKKANHILGRELSCIIAGFHLFNPVSKKVESNELITKIGQKLLNSNTRYYTCHCTGKRAFDMLQSAMGEKIGYLSTGSRIEI